MNDLRLLCCENARVGVVLALVVVAERRKVENFCFRGKKEEQKMKKPLRGSGILAYIAGICLCVAFLADNSPNSLEILEKISYRLGVCQIGQTLGLDHVGGVSFTPRGRVKDFQSWDLMSDCDESAAQQKVKGCTL